MPVAKGTLIIDKEVSESKREEISTRISNDLNALRDEVSQRESVIRRRQNFYEGRQQNYTNVVGLTNKMQEGHINAVFNYTRKFTQKLHQSLTNSIPRIKLKPKDEGDEIEVARTEAVETAIYQVLNDNKFFEIVFKRCGMNQVRDGDFDLTCKVMDEQKGRRIVITPVEDMLKLLVWWDDASGSSFSAIAFKDMWTTTKIKREFGVEVAAFRDSAANATEKKGNHLNDQYGLLATSPLGGKDVSTGETKLPKGEVVDYWGYEVLKGEVKVVNIIFINREIKQFVVTNYETIPHFIGHSFVNPGRPWSTSIIDDLIDPQVELNDRTSEEGDLIRIGAHMKFKVVNMPDFDPDSVKPGSGQIIFVEGENADFIPLTFNASPFPSEAYLNRVLEHMFNIGLPKIALSAGTAPYTGRVAAIQYQPIVDLVWDLRIQWNIVLTDLIKTIQKYFIDYFPETHPLMTEHIAGEGEGDLGQDGDLVIRDIEIDWDNVLPLSRSDKVVDASTMRDRHSISLYTYLEEAGYKDPSREIKRLKKEAADKELVTIMEKFLALSKGATQAELEKQKAFQQAAEEQAENQAVLTEQGEPTPKSTPPILNQSQNDGRRGVLTGTGTPTGQTASPEGAVKQKTQNINAKAGV